MNEDPKDKPIRELLQDISSNSEPARIPPRGLIRPKLVARVTFFASLMCLLFTTAAFLAVIWDVADREFAFRCVSSMFVILFALFVFRFINSQFE
jgi:hypothetical protein